MLVDLVAHFFHHAERLGVGELQPVGALLDQGRIDIHDRGQPHDVADLLAVQAVGVAGAVEEFVVMQHHVKHFGRESALGSQRVIAAARMLAHLFHLVQRQRARLVQDRHRNERLADVVQQGCTGETALVVLAHAKVLRVGDRKAGNKQAMAVAAGVMAADRRQPFAQGRMLDRLENLVLSLDDVAEFQGNAGRKLIEDLDHHGMRRFDAPVQDLAAIGLVISVAVRKRGANPLQDTLRIERPRDGVGGAERPGLHRSVMQRIRQHEQPRHFAIGLGAQLVAHQLHALGGTQVDVDHDSRQVAFRRVGDV